MHLSCYGVSATQLETPAKDSFYQLGGFALDGMRFGFPDMDVNRLGEKSALFRQTAPSLRALTDLKSGKPMPKNESVTMMEFEKIVDIAYWKSIEKKILPLGEKVRQSVNKIFKGVA